MRNFVNVEPPSGVSVVPVIWLASSDHKNRMLEAIFSGGPARFSWTLGMIASSYKGIDRSDIEDCTTATAGEHGSGLILHAQIVAFQVDVENLVPFLFGEIGDAS
jgi:hypothetical protein